MATIVLKEGHKKDTRHYEVGAYYAQNVDTIELGGPYVVV